MKSKVCALAGLLVLAGCSAIPAALLSAGLSVAASVLKLDAAIVEAWTEARREKPLPEVIPEEGE